MMIDKKQSRENVLAWLFFKASHCKLFFKPSHRFVTTLPFLSKHLKCRESSLFLKQKTKNLTLIGEKHTGKQTFLNYLKNKKFDYNHNHLTINGKNIRSVKDLSRLLNEKLNRFIYLEHIDSLNEPSLRFFLKWLNYKTEKTQIITSIENEDPFSRSLNTLIEQSQLILFPPLNKRPEDIYLLANFFLIQLNEAPLTKDLLKHLVTLKWSKGIHQLKYTLLFATKYTYYKKILTKKHIEIAFQEAKQYLDFFEVLEHIDLDQLLHLAQTYGYKKLISFTERLLLEKTSLTCQGCSSQAASMLFLPITTYLSKKNNHY